MPKGTRGDFGALAGNRRQPWQSPRELSTQRQLGSSRDWSSPDCKGCAKNRHLSAGSPVQAQLPAKSRDKGEGKVEDDSRERVTPSFAKLTRMCVPGGGLFRGASCAPYPPAPCPPRPGRSLRRCCVPRKLVNLQCPRSPLVRPLRPPKCVPPFLKRRAWPDDCAPRTLLLCVSFLGVRERGQ